MKKQLVEIERNMRDTLRKVNNITQPIIHYEHFEIDLWPEFSNPTQFRLSFWDGQNHAQITKKHYHCTPKQLIEWFERKEILFQKFKPI